MNTPSPPRVKIGKNIVRYQAADVAQDILAYYRATARPPVTGILGPEDALWRCMERLIGTAVESRLSSSVPRSAQPTH